MRTPHLFYPDLCAKHFMAFSRYSSQPPNVLNLIISNTLVFLAQTMTSGGLEPNTAADLFALHHPQSTYFNPYQLVTHLFMHGSFFHLLFNMFALWMFGSVLERNWGPKRFLIFYFVCGLAAGIAQIGNYLWEFRDVPFGQLSTESYDQVQMILQRYYTVGASGAVMGLLAAFGYLFPNTEMMIIPIPFPVKAKWAILGMIALDVFGGVVNTPGDNVAHFAHLGGAVTGFLLVWYWNKSRRNTFY
jgi:membrane associated rhomboid family serine protease